MSGETAQVMAPRVAIGLVLVSMLSLLAYFALSAYAPDFRNESDGQAHALSNPPSVLQVCADGKLLLLALAHVIVIHHLLADFAARAG